MNKNKNKTVTYGYERSRQKGRLGNSTGPSEPSLSLLAMKLSALVGNLLSKSIKYYYRTSWLPNFRDWCSDINAYADLYYHSTKKDKYKEEYFTKAFIAYSRLKVGLSVIFLDPDTYLLNNKSEILTKFGVIFQQMSEDFHKWQRSVESSGTSKEQKAKNKEFKKEFSK